MEPAALETVSQVEGFKCPCVCAFSILGEVPPPSGYQGKEDLNQRSEMIKCMLQKGPWGCRVGYRETSEMLGQHYNPGVS